MSKLYIEEYDNIKKGAIKKQYVYITNTSTSSGVMDDQTRFVRLTSEEDCFFEIGDQVNGVAALTAEGTSRFLPSYRDLVVSIKPNQVITVVKKTDTPKSQSTLTVFGETLTAALTPLFQSNFVYNINTAIYTTSTTGSGSVTQENSMAKVDTGAATSSKSQLFTIERLKYDHGEGAVSRFTAIFTEGVSGSTQIIGIGDDDDGLFFGYNGADFGIMRRSFGSDVWTTQSNWNQYKCDGTDSFPELDFTKGNVFQIKYQWLGFGQIGFYIESPDDGLFYPVHFIQYTNTETVPSLGNPTLPFCMDAENTTNNTAISIRSASVMFGIEGKNIDYGIIRGIKNDKTSVGTTLTNIITIRNKSTFSGKTNKSIVKLILVDVSVDGTKPTEFELLYNTTLGGTPSYVDIETSESIIEYDTAGTTITGGRIITASNISRAGTKSIDLDDWRIILNPGDTATIAVNATQSTTDVAASISWIEEF